MPGGDRTGPQGSGPKTGRAAGCCSGYAIPGYANVNEQNYIPRRYCYRGFRRGYGRRIWGLWGKGYRQKYFPDKLPYHRAESNTVNKENEKKYLEDKITELEDEIKIVKDRIQEISKEKKD